jgi:hypothetical protein
MGWAMPFDEWITLGFMHDGIDSMVITANGQVVATRSSLLASIPEVGPAGVARVLNGDIDEIKSWRLDPDAMRREFLARPWDQQTAKCWEKLGRCVTQALANNPDCAAKLARTCPD